MVKFFMITKFLIIVSFYLHLLVMLQTEYDINSWFENNFFIIWQFSLFLEYHL